MWQTKNWKGNLEACGKFLVVPSDEELHKYFENGLRYDNVNITEEDFVDTRINIPLLDDPNIPQEVVEQVTRMKPEKSCGPDEIPPGVFRLLPLDWILCITALLISVFMSGSYPDLWSKAKFFTVSKRGDKKRPKQLSRH